MIKFVRIASFLLAAIITIISIFYLNPEEELALARAAYKSGDMDQAVRNARRASSASNDDKEKISALYIQARAASKLNWTKKSVDYLDKILSINQEHLSSLLFRGQLLQQLGHNKEALIDLNHGLDLGKGNMSSNQYAYFLSKRGLAHLALKQNSEAEEDAREAIADAPKLPDGYLLMSHVMEEKEEHKEAFRACEKAYQLSVERDKYSILTPEGRELSQRVVDLKVKYLLAK